MEIWQGEAIANNLRSMFGIKVPIITIVIGEGGSGGALAIACANKILMLENAVFFVARLLSATFFRLFLFLNVPISKVSYRK
jgi:ATP-dependent protease ClpP protease subunit